MKKLVFFLLALLSVGKLLAGGDEEYPVLTIPAALLKNASYVVRDEEINFEILSKGEAIKRSLYVITILNESGNDKSGLTEYYDKIHTIESIEGTLYDAFGRVIKKLKSRDIIDRSGVDDNNLMDDYRIKIHNFNHASYPYTVKYEVTEHYKGTLFFPVWMPQVYNNLSVEKSRIIITAPLDYSFRHKAYNYKGEPVVAEQGKKKSMTWEVSNLSAIKSEYASPDRYKITAAVFFAPTDFKIEDYTGNMQTWNEFGKFVYSLTAGRYELPDNVKQKVKELTGQLQDGKEKIKVLYNYLQQNTRYISIQLGIGGWQPFDAKYVAAKGYGDCKALTNYMYSLLKEANIPSYYTLIKAGRNASEVIADFPSQQFNHVILCVPLKKDTIWLECTSQILPAGYLSDFTCNRYALLVSAEGGKLVRTPVYGVNENLQYRKLNAVLDETGTLQIKAENNYLAIQQDRLHQLTNYLTKEKVKEVLEEEFSFPTYEINGFSYKEIKAEIPSIYEELNITVNNYATITGKRLFLTPNIMTRTSRKLARDSTRKYDLYLGFAYRDIDTVSLVLPQGYEQESIPKEIGIANKFGKYQSKVLVMDGKVEYYRLMEEFGGEFPASDYPELVKFYEEVYKADRNGLVLVKKENVPLKAF